ncbi:MAG TPA: nucleotidyltransferase family protein [Longimicrobiaceae bacterium]|nr:nucleotidyltransferase family protein [Longimicrobiaceae bacterium]
MAVIHEVGARIEIPYERISEFCRKWNVVEFALFGSVLRDDFGPGSDVDVMVTFEPEQTPSLFEHVDMQDELAEIFGRPVDLLTRAGVEHGRNPFRKRAILDSARVVYAA